MVARGTGGDKAGTIVPTFLNPWSVTREYHSACQDSGLVRRVSRVGGVAGNGSRGGRRGRADDHIMRYPPA